MLQECCRDALVMYALQITTCIKQCFVPWISLVTCLLEDQMFLVLNCLEEMLSNGTRRGIDVNVAAQGTPCGMPDYSTNRNN